MERGKVGSVLTMASCRCCRRPDRLRWLVETVLIRQDVSESGVREQTTKNNSFLTLSTPIRNVGCRVPLQFNIIEFEHSRYSPCHPKRANQGCWDWQGQYLEGSKHDTIE